MAKFENSKCATQFSAAAKGIISDAEAKAIFDEIDRRKTEGRIDDVAKQVTGKVLDQKEYEALQTKRTELGNIRAQRKIEGRTNDMISKGLSPAKAFEADSLGMSGHPGIGERDNAESRRQSLQHVESGRIAAQLKQEKLLPYVTSGAFDKAIMEQRWLQNMTDAEAKANLKTPNFDKLKPEEQKAVTRIAEIYNTQIEHLRQVNNARGAMISKTEGYGGAQSHDTQRIRNAANPGAINLLDRTSVASKNAYQRDLARMIDMDATRTQLVKMGRLGILEDIDPKKFMDSLWNIFALGVRKDREAGSASYGGNIAAEAEAARILQFKGPAEQSEYGAKYGKGTMWESHLAQIRQMSHTQAALDFYGPSVEANFQKVFDKKLVELRDKGDVLSASSETADQANNIYKQIDQLQGSQAMKYLDAFQGATKDPGNMTQARLVDNAMALTRMSLLGSSFFSNIPVFWTSALQGNYAGVNLLKASFRSLFGVLERVGRDDLKQWGRQTGVGNVGLHGQFASSMMDGFNGKPGGLMANLESKFFKGVGLTGLKDMLASNYVFMTANEMAHNAEKEFAQLPGNMQRHLSDYRISPQEWDLIRQHGVTEASGYQVLASDKIRDVPLEAFKGIDGAQTDNSLLNARINTEQKLANLFRDSSDYATVEPDLKTRQLTPFVNGTKGTISGDLGRLTMQFSTWGFAHGVKVIQRQYKSRSLPEFLGVTLGGLMISGIVSYVARQASQGRSPLSNQDLYSGDADKESEAWAKLLTVGAGQSGMGGMFGDLLFSQTYANGRGSPAGVLGGPLADNVTQAAQFGYDALLKHKVNGAEMLRYAQGNTPFVNVWWCRPLVNYLLSFGLQEHLQPGTLRRMEQSSAKAGNPYFDFAKPSQAAVQYQ